LGFRDDLPSAVGDIEPAGEAEGVVGNDDFLMM
jgi:hypothetical protein